MTITPCCLYVSGSKVGIMMTIIILITIALEEGLNHLQVRS